MFQKFTVSLFPLIFTPCLTSYCLSHALVVKTLSAPFQSFWFFDFVGSFSVFLILCNLSRAAFFSDIVNDNADEGCSGRDLARTEICESVASCHTSEVVVWCFPDAHWHQGSSQKHRWRAHRERRNQSGRPVLGRTCQYWPWHSFTWVETHWRVFIILLSPAQGSMLDVLRKACVYSSQSWKLPSVCLWKF